MTENCIKFHTRTSCMPQMKRPGEINIIRGPVLKERRIINFSATEECKPSNCCAGHPEFLNAQGNKTFPFKCKNTIKLGSLACTSFLFRSVLRGLLCARCPAVARTQSGRKAARGALTLAFTSPYLWCHPGEPFPQGTWAMLFVATAATFVWLWKISLPLMVLGVFRTVLWLLEIERKVLRNKSELSPGKIPAEREGVSLFLIATSGNSSLCYTDQFMAQRWKFDQFHPNFHVV